MGYHNRKGGPAPSIESLQPCKQARLLDEGRARLLGGVDDGGGLGLLEPDPSFVDQQELLAAAGLCQGSGAFGGVREAQADFRTVGGNPRMASSSASRSPKQSM